MSRVRRSPIAIVCRFRTMSSKTEKKRESQRKQTFLFMLAKSDSTIRIEVGIAKEAKLNSNRIGLSQVAE